MGEGSIGLEAEEGVLDTTNSAGRSGAWFLPTREEGGSLPLLVAYHGTGGRGASILSMFRDEAELRGVAVVAPDSRQAPSGEWTWEVGNHASEVTEDYEHTLACIDEFREQFDLDEDRVLAVGFSGGASSAPYIGSNEILFTGFGVLHGGVIRGGIGENRVPVWLSTGEDDTLRTPSELESDAEYLEELGFSDVELRTYAGGHNISDTEREGVISWWLGAAK